MSLFGLEPPAPAVPRTKEEVKATIKEAEKQKKAKEKEIKASAGAKSKAVKAEQQARRKLEKVQKKGHPEHHEDHQAALSQLQAAVDAAVEAQAKMLAAEAAAELALAEHADAKCELAQHHELAWSAEPPAECVHASKLKKASKATNTGASAGAGAGGKGGANGGGEHLGEEEFRRMLIMTLSVILALGWLRRPYHIAESACVGYVRRAFPLKW